jgi:hypothetical protein
MERLRSLKPETKDANFNRRMLRGQDTLARIARHCIISFASLRYYRFDIIGSNVA